MKTRVIVFDDNKQRRDGLEMLLNSMENMVCVGLFSDCRDILRNLQDTCPDVVLMDIDMPHVNGIEGVRVLREKYPDLVVIMQTVFEDDVKVFDAICAGANGYILKQSSPIQLLNAIEDVLRGGAPMTPAIARKVLQLFKKTNHRPVQKSFDLTKRELEILNLLVKGNSYKMIADAFNISYPTVNTHVTRIYSKLQVHSVAGAVALAMKEGLVKGDE